MRFTRTPALLMAVAALAACARGPRPAATAPQPALAPAAAAAPAAATVPPAAPAPVDLSGEWSFTVDLGGQTIGGTITLTRSGTGYTGQALPDGMSAAPLRSAQITGSRVQMVFDAPDGEAVFDGQLSADRRSLSGTVAYNGQTLTFNATKR
jgi:hypothetical protein